MPDYNIFEFLKDNRLNNDEEIIAENKQVNLRNFQFFSNSGIHLFEINNLQNYEQCVHTQESLFDLITKNDYFRNKSSVSLSKIKPNLWNLKFMEVITESFSIETNLEVKYLSSIQNKNLKLSSEDLIEQILTKMTDEFMTKKMNELEEVIKNQIENRKKEIEQLIESSRTVFTKDLETGQDTLEGPI